MVRPHTNTTVIFQVSSFLISFLILTFNNINKRCLEFLYGKCISNGDAPSTNSNDLMKHECTVLEIQFRSINYALVARMCKNLEQKKPCWEWCSRWKQYKTVVKLKKVLNQIFTCNFKFNTTKQRISTLLPVIFRLFVWNESNGWRTSCTYLNSKLRATSRRRVPQY